MDSHPLGHVVLTVLDTWTGRTNVGHMNADAWGRMPAQVREEWWCRLEVPLW